MWRAIEAAMAVSHGAMSSGVFDRARQAADYSEGMTGGRHAATDRRVPRPFNERSTLPVWPPLFRMQAPNLPWYKGKGRRLSPAALVL